MIFWHSSTHRITKPCTAKMDFITSPFFCPLAIILRWHCAILAETQTPLQGLSDHLVSEAIYLADPEGNGIEIYADRPRSTWYKDGVMQMATIAMNVQSVLSEIKDGDDTVFCAPEGTIMGHVHLYVDNVQEAIDFYVNTLGMDLLFQMPSAGFLSYDGYHHHVGVNTWAGIVPHGDNLLGLDHYELFNDMQNQTVDDPSANRIEITISSVASHS